MAAPPADRSQDDSASDCHDRITYEIVNDVAVEVVIDLYRAGGWWRELPDWREAIPRMIRGSFCFVVARNADNRIVGMGRVISDGASDAYIQDVVVLPELRGQGIGSGIIRLLASHCTQQGIGWVGLIGEPGTQAFYERLGFNPLNGYVPMLLGGQP